MSERGYETAGKVWSGKDIVVIFHTLGITADTFNILKVYTAYRPEWAVPNCSDCTTLIHSNIEHPVIMMKRRRA